MPLFSSTCQNLSDFAEGSPYLSTGETVTCLPNIGRNGSGDYGLKVSVTSSANEVGVRVGNIGGQGRSFKFDFKLPSSGSLTGFHIISHAWAGETSSYGPDIWQVGIQSNSRVGGTYNFTMQTPFDSYASLSLATKPLSRDQWYTIEIRLSDDQIALYIDGEYQTYARVPNAGRNIRSATLGKFTVYGGSNGYTGDLFFDNVILDTSVPAAVANDTTSRIQAAIEGYLDIGMRADGGLVRHMGYESGGSKGDGTFGFSFPGSDIVSEGPPYALQFCVWSGRQAEFDLIENFCYNKLCRRNPQVSTATNNAEGSPSAPNLMGWKWEDDRNQFFDANWATDADVDRIKALYWAHKRWGSAGAINYLARANAAAADLKNFSFREDTGAVINSVTQTVQIMSADKFNSGSAFEINPSYYDPVCYELAKEANPGDATFWTQAITGTYHALNTNVQFSGYGGPTEWATYDLAQHKAVIRPQRAADRGDGYGYNSFRTLYRVYWHWLLYGDTRARDYLKNAFRTFSQNEWNTTNPQRFAMEKNNLGTGLYNGYEKSQNNYAQWIPLQMDPSLAEASDVWTKKLDIDKLFRNSNNGAFFADNVGDNDPSTPGDTGNFSYFNGSWMLFAYITQYGNRSGISYGFDIGSASTPPTPPTPPASSRNNATLLGVG